MPIQISAATTPNAASLCCTKAKTAAELAKSKGLPRAALSGRRIARAHCSAPTSIPTANLQLAMVVIAVAPIQSMLSSSKRAGQQDRPARANGNSQRIGSQPKRRVAGEALQQAELPLRTLEGGEQSIADGHRRTGPLSFTGAPRCQSNNCGCCQ